MYLYKPFLYGENGISSAIENGVVLTLIVQLLCFLPGWLMSAYAIGFLPLLRMRHTGGVGDRIHRSRHLFLVPFHCLMIFLPRHSYGRLGEVRLGTHTG